MFSGFNLEIDAESVMNTFNSSFDEYKKIGENHLKQNIEDYNCNLKKLINCKNINGSQLQNHWFPEIEADIFLSHSHKDCDLANALAGWMHKTFGLKVFVDSNVWGYSDELLEELNSRYSNKRHDNKNGYLYDHESCCKASAHVNIMLSTALHKMIDNVECVMLLNTDNSVQVFKEECFNSTYSPWIYSEIMCSQIIRKKPLICYREYSELMHCYESTNIKCDSSDLIISYIIPLKHLKPIDFGDLIMWHYKYNNTTFKDYPLDSLYSFTYKNDVEIARKLYRSLDYDKIEKLKKFYSGETDSDIELTDIIRIINGGA